MTPAEVSQHITEICRVKNLIPGYHQLVVKGEGKVPHRVPAQEPGYVWELVKATRIDDMDVLEHSRGTHYKVSRRWDGLYQYHKEIK